MINKQIMLMPCSNNLLVLLESNLKSLVLSQSKEEETLKIGKNKSEMMLKRTVLLKLLFCFSRRMRKNITVNLKDF